MSDLLSNLVSKTLNVASVIEPRPLSRFEPWQPAGTVESTRPNSGMEIDRPPMAAQIDVDQPAPPPVSRPPRALRRPSIEPETRFGPSPTSNTARPVWRHDNEEAATRAPIERVMPDPIASDRRPAVSERVEQVMIERSPIERDEPDRSPRESIAHLSAMPTQIEAAGYANTARAADRSEQSINASTALPGVESIDAQRAIGERPPADRVPAAPPLVVPSANVLPLHNTSFDERPPHAPHPRPVPLVERLPARPPRELNVRSTGTPPPPTIHVSIGRVEVRAALPTAPVKRSSVSTSSTSLDDYLRWRSGDRR